MLGQCVCASPVTVSLTSSAVIAEGRNARAACSMGVWQKHPCEDDSSSVVRKCHVGLLCSLGGPQKIPEETGGDVRPLP